jgi:hypothetical protein
LKRYFSFLDDAQIKGFSVLNNNTCAILWVNVQQPYSFLYIYLVSTLLLLQHFVRNRYPKNAIFSRNSLQVDSYWKRKYLREVLTIEFINDLCGCPASFLAASLERIIDDINRQFVFFPTYRSLEEPQTMSTRRDGTVPRHCSHKNGYKLIISSTLFLFEVVWMMEIFAWNWMWQVKNCKRMPSISSRHSIDGLDWKMKINRDNIFWKESQVVKDVKVKRKK